MCNIARKDTKDYENLTNGATKEWTIPGYPSCKLSKLGDKDEIVHEQA